MKTKRTFLLALTFLFLFSGSVYGEVFDRKDEIVVLFCDDDPFYFCEYNTGRKLHYKMHLKGKTIDEFCGIAQTATYEIIKQDYHPELYIVGRNKNPTQRWKSPRNIMISRYSINQESNPVVELWKSQDMEIFQSNGKCRVGKKRF